MIRLARAFCDNAVFQRNQEIAILGSSDEDATISVKLNGEEILRTAVEKGQFTILLPAQEAMFDATLEVGDAKLSGIDIGEVWIAGGQSNMEFKLKFVKNIEDELKSADDEHLRMYTVGQYSFEGQRDLGYKSWNPWDRWIKYGEDGTEAFSAIGLFFAKRLREKGIPVGIINCSWGGTKACTWTKRSRLTGDLTVCVKEFEDTCKALDFERYEKIKQYIWPSRFAKPEPGKNYEDIIVKNTYNPSQLMQMMCQLMAGDQAASEELVKLFGGPLTIEDMTAIGPGNENEPGVLYENMVTEIAGYSAKGVLWYQGCSDESHADIYDKMFGELISCWRESWMSINPSQEKLPFLFVQLAPFGTWMGNSSSNYPMLREAQQKVADNVDDTYMASITDVGNVFDIHPKDKKPVAERLFMLADKYIYGNSSILADSPTASGVERIADNAIAIDFENADGLHIVETDFSGYNGFDLEEIRTFDETLIPPVLGGVNGLFLTADEDLISSADCKIENDRLIIISDDLKGKEDIKISFAKTPFYQVNVYNSSMVPVRPFEI